MSHEKLQLWLNQIPDHPALLACGFLFANRQVVTRSFSEEYPGERLEQACRLLAEAGERLDVRSSSVTRLTWTFEHARLHLAPGPQRVNFMVVTLAQDTAGAPDLVDRLVRDFIRIAAPEGGS
jgi:hypothetical protein